MKVRVVKNEFDSGLIERIIGLDRANMTEILAEAGIEFPEEKRRKGFDKNPVLIVAENAGKIAGYLEFTRSRTDENEIYISSIQLDKKFRHSKLLLRLIDKFVETVEPEKFTGFETNVQKNNLPVVRLYRRLGFRFEENPRNPASWQLKAERDILENSPVKSLIEKWRRKKNRK